MPELSRRRLLSAAGTVAAATSCAASYSNRPAELEYFKTFQDAPTVPRSTRAG